MTAPLVSVVIPSYNSGRFLGQAIESVLGQDYPNQEVIVVDDGSSDETPHVARAYWEKIRYVWQPNCGPSSARNAGISFAKGDYVAFLDADDLWLQGKVSAQVGEFSEHPAVALVYGQTAVFDEATRKDLRIQPLEPVSGRVFERLLASESGPIPLSTSMIRTSVLKDLGGFDESMCLAEDLSLWLRLAKRHEIHGIARVLARRRLHGKNLSAIDCRMSTIDCLDRIVGEFPEEDPSVSAVMRAAYLRHGEVVARNYIYGRKYAAAHKVCDGLMRRSLATPRVKLYWLMTLVPTRFFDGVRRLRRTLKRRHSTGWEL